MAFFQNNNNNNNNKTTKIRIISKLKYRDYDF